MFTQIMDEVESGKLVKWGSKEMWAWNCTFANRWQEKRINGTVDKQLIRSPV
jgi:hypothetical protein